MHIIQLFMFFVQNLQVFVVSQIRCHCFLPSDGCFHLTTGGIRMEISSLFGDDQDVVRLFCKKDPSLIKPVVRKPGEKRWDEIGKQVLGGSSQLVSG